MGKTWEHSSHHGTRDWCRRFIICQSLPLLCIAVKSKNRGGLGMRLRQSIILIVRKAAHTHTHTHTHTVIPNYFRVNHHHSITYLLLHAITGQIVLKVPFSYMYFNWTFSPLCYVLKLIFCSIKSQEATLHWQVSSHLLKMMIIGAHDWVFACC